MDRMERLDLEFASIDYARDKMRYLGFSPKHDTWRTYCAEFGRKLDDELRRVDIALEKW